MRQHEVKRERELGGNTFYIRPFGAFKAANMSGEILSLLTPVIAGVAPLVLGSDAKAGGASILDMDAEKAAPHLSNAMSGVSGDKLEALLKKLLIQHRNVSVELEGQSEAQLLTEDIANEIFCGDTQDMFILAFDVIQVNYSGFFERLGGQYGKALNAFRVMGQPSSKDTAS